FHTPGEYDLAGSKLSTAPVTSFSVPPGVRDAARGCGAVATSSPATAAGAGGPAARQPARAGTTASAATSPATPRRPHLLPAPQLVWSGGRVMTSAPPRATR